MTAALLGLAAALCWGVHDFAGRFATRAVGTNATTLVVVFAGVVLMSGHLAATTTMPALSLRHVLLIAVTGGAYAVALYLLFVALRVGPLSVVTLIVGAYPATTVLIAIAAGARPTPIVYAAILAVIAGMALVVALARAGGEGAGAVADWNVPRAAIHAGLAHLSFALSITVGQGLAPAIGGIETTALSRLAGLLVVAAFCLRSLPRLDTLLRWSPVLVAMGALDVVAVGSIFAAGLHASPELAPVVSSAYGAVAVLLAFVVLKEPISPGQWAGMALTLAGTVVLSLPR